MQEHSRHVGRVSLEVVAIESRVSLAWVACGDASVLVVRTCKRACKHLVSVHPTLKKSTRMKAVDKCYRAASALLRKLR